MKKTSLILGELPHRLFMWLRCHFPRLPDLRSIEVRGETRLLYDQLHPDGGGRRVHLLPHWVERLASQDPAAVELLCRQLVELEERTRRRAVQRARELRAQWEAAADSRPGKASMSKPAKVATPRAPSQKTDGPARSNPTLPRAGPSMNARLAIAEK